MVIEGSEHVTSFVDLVKSLKSTVDNAQKHFLFADKMVLVRKDMTDRLTTLENNIPDAVKAAAEIVDKEQSIITEATTEANSIKAAAISEGQAIVAGAKAELERLKQEIMQAQKEAERIQMESARAAEETARRAQAQADGILAQAQQQGNQIVNAAEARAQQLTSEHNIYARATEQAAALTEKTKNDMDELRRNTFAYLDETLGQAETYVTSLVTDIRKEREHIHSAK